MPRIVGAVALVVSLWSTVALAQQGPGPAEDEGPLAGDAEARGLFTAGEAAYSAGRFEDALSHFRRAYELSGRAALLYNIGLSAANIRRDREALEAFERYLAETEDAANRAIVEGRIVTLRRSIEQDEARAGELEAAQERARAADQARAESSSGGGASTAGWVLVVGGGVALATGAVVFAVGAGDVSTVEGAADGTPWVELRDPYNRAPVLTSIGLVVGSLGAAALATGLVLVLTSGEGGETTVALGPTGLWVRGEL